MQEMSYEVYEWIEDNTLLLWKASFSTRFEADNYVATRACTTKPMLIRAERLNADDTSNDDTSNDDDY